MSEKNQGFQHRERQVEVGTLFLSYDENIMIIGVKHNVIAENVLSYFLCLSSILKYRLHVS